MNKNIILSACVGIMCCGCTASPDKSAVGNEPPKEDVERIYNLYLTGQYEAYVNEMLSCDNMPDFYRRQMADLHKQHAYERQEKKGHAIKATLERVDLTTTGKQADVFLRVFYHNQTHELVMISMIYHAGRWRLK